MAFWISSRSTNFQPRKANIYNSKNNKKTLHSANCNFVGFASESCKELGATLAMVVALVGVIDALSHSSTHVSDIEEPLIAITSRTLGWAYEHAAARCWENAICRLAGSTWLYRLYCMCWMRSSRDSGGVDCVDRYVSAPNLDLWNLWQPPGQGQAKWRLGWGRRHWRRIVGVGAVRKPRIKDHREWSLSFPGADHVMGTRQEWFSGAAKSGGRGALCYCTFI